jgi:hypothetical protein
VFDGALLALIEASIRDDPAEPVDAESFAAIDVLDAALTAKRDAAAPGLAELGDRVAQALAAVAVARARAVDRHAGGVADEGAGIVGILEATAVATLIAE